MWDFDFLFHFSVKFLQANRIAPRLKRVKTGTMKNIRYIPIYMIVNNLGQDLCRLILPFHAFTGCDSTRCFKWKGKKKVFHRGPTDVFL